MKIVAMIGIAVAAIILGYGVLVVVFALQN